MELKDKNIKKIFRSKGACSHTTYFLLNEAFGNNKPNEEHASDPFGGGVVQYGHQCGMLWGASMAIGTEAHKRHNGNAVAVDTAVRATQHVMKSFKEHTGVINCRDFVKSDFRKPLGLLKYMITGKMFKCFHLAENWIPKAFDAAADGVEMNGEALNYKPISCASETVKKMGGSEEEQLIVAGFAGGLGLSGKACGALSAAVWKTVLEKVKKGEWKYKIKDDDSQKVIDRFFDATDGKMLCSDICDCKFNSLEEHTDFIQKGGCNELISALANVSEETEKNE